MAVAGPLEQEGALDLVRLERLPPDVEAVENVLRDVLLGIVLLLEGLGLLAEQLDGRLLRLDLRWDLAALLAFLLLLLRHAQKCWSGALDRRLLLAPLLHVEITLPRDHALDLISVEDDLGDCRLEYHLLGPNALEHSHLLLTLVVRLIL